MHFSNVVRTTSSPHGSLPSPDGSLIASLHGTRLLFRIPTSLEVQRTINLPAEFASRIQFMRWSPRKLKYYDERSSAIDKEDKEGGMQKILLADDQTIEVFDVDDESWTATVVPGLTRSGGVKWVDFGRNADEVLVFSDYQLKLTVWSLVSTRHVDIPHPKFLTKGYGHRPNTSHFALLTRPNTHDVISIHEHTTYRLISTIALPTVDAQGLSWSPCGQWIAIWDHAPSCYRVLVLTADGQLFKTCEKLCDGLGVKTVEWSPASDYLVIADHDGKLTFLSSYRFSPMIEMRHTSTIRTANISVWSEQISGMGERSYASVGLPVNLPVVASSPTDPVPKIGVSSMSFNLDGTMVASRDDRMPTTAWIWSLKLLQPTVVLVQLSHIKSITWHPTQPHLLMLICNVEEAGNSVDTNAVYLWSSNWESPRAIRVPLEKLSNGAYGRWVNTSSEKISLPVVTSSTSREGLRSPNIRSTRRLSGSSLPSPRSGSSTNIGYGPTLENVQSMLVFGDKENFVIGYVEEEPKVDNSSMLEQEETMDQVSYVNEDESSMPTPTSISHQSARRSLFIEECNGV